MVEEIFANLGKYFQANKVTQQQVYYFSIDEVKKTVTLKSLLASPIRLTSKTISALPSSLTDETGSGSFSITIPAAAKTLEAQKRAETHNKMRGIIFIILSSTLVGSGICNVWILF